MISREVEKLKELLLFSFCFHFFSKKTSPSLQLKINSFFAVIKSQF